MLAGIWGLWPKQSYKSDLLKMRARDPHKGDRTKFQECDEF